MGYFCCDPPEYQNPLLVKFSDHFGQKHFVGSLLIDTLR